MNTLHLIRTLGPLDARGVGRDALLRWLIVMPIGIALAIRGVLPALLERAAPLLPFDPMAFYAPLMAYVLLLITPLLTGMVIGFQLLDQRDDGVLDALQITPPRLRGYLAYKLVLPVLVGIALTLITFPLAGLSAGGPGPLLLAALSIAPHGPLFALFLTGFAANKVQGFALTKISNVLFLLPIAVLFVPPVWHLLLAVAPGYWPARLLWALQNGEPGALCFFAAALAYQLLLGWALLRRLERR
jgi:fluoroquinolone transport system permease protein